MSKNIDINKIQTLMNAVSNGIWSQCEVMDLLYSCTQQEAQFISKSYQMFVVELNDFNDNFDVVKTMSIGHGQYEIKDCLTIEDPSSIGLKRMGELGAYAVNTDQQAEQKDWKMSTDNNRVFSLQALDPKNLGFNDVNELADLLEFVEQNKVYVPYSEAGFFKAAKGKNVKPFYTSNNVEGAIHMNGAFWVPSATMLDIMILAKQTSSKVIVQCLRKIVEKCGPLTMNKIGKIRVNKKEGGRREATKYQEHNKSELELEYLKAVEKGSEDEIISTFWSFSSEFDIDTGNAYSSEKFAKIYKEWCEQKDFKVNEESDHEDVQDEDVKNDDGFIGEKISFVDMKLPLQKLDEFEEEIKLDKRLMVASDIKKDIEIFRSTSSFFTDHVKMKDNSYKIGNTQIPLAKNCNYEPSDFIKDMKRQRIQSVAKLLLVEDFDLKTNVFMDLYHGNEKGSIKSHLLHNIQYLGFRIVNNQKSKTAAPIMEGIANMPAFVIYYEIMQCIKETMTAVNQGVIPSNLVGVMNDILMVYWLNELMGETGKFKAGDAGVDWFRKTYKIKFTSKQQMPKQYGAGLKKEKVSFGSDGNSTSMFF